MPTQVWVMPPARSWPELSSPCPGFLRAARLSLQGEGKRGNVKQLDIFPFSNAKLFRQGKQNPLHSISTQATKDSPQKV